MKKTIIFVGSMILVVTALYFTVNSVLAARNRRKNPKYVSYSALEKRLEEILDNKIDEKINTALDEKLDAKFDEDLGPAVDALVSESLDEFRSEIVSANNRMSSIQQTLDVISNRLDIIEAEIN